MPHPNQHDQPVEGGEDVIDRALKKQAERQASQRANKPDPSRAKPAKDDKRQK